MDYGILIGGWMIYFFLHSILAAESTKRRAQHIFGNAFHFYRLVYSVISTVGLVALLIFNGSIPGADFFDRSGIFRYLSLMFTTFGVMTMQLAFRHYKLKSFLGFAEEKAELKIDGILKVVRHPIYAGLILITIGFFLFIPNLPTLISCGCMFAYLPIGIYLEEKKLIAVFGEKYLQYKITVPSILPRILFKKKS
jgi:protein-S-isoprenylcysteine O-methyltransferase Ste14